MARVAHRRLLILLSCVALVGVLATVATAIWHAQRPSNDRDWNLDQRILPHAEIVGDRATIYNIRNFTYRSTTDYTPGYYDATFDLRTISTAYYVVEPFTRFQGPAHTFLTFEFTDGRYVSVSIEIRKRTGQVFSEWRSALPYYELMYVVADENDVIKLRSNYRKDTVFVYPVKADQQVVRGIFTEYLRRVNQLYTTPEFYNLFTNNCTTNIVDAINRAAGTNIPWSYELLLPSYSDRLALDRGFLDTDLSLEAARAKYRINERAERFADDPAFSRKIREPLP